MPAKKKTQEEPKKVAIFSKGKLFHPTLGRLDKGYSVVSKEDAQEWMKISNKVREATPEEVAMAYGV